MQNNVLELVVWLNKAANNEANSDRARAAFKTYAELLERAVNGEHEMQGKVLKAAMGATEANSQLTATIELLTMMQDFYSDLVFLSGRAIVAWKQAGAEGFTK